MVRGRLGCITPKVAVTAIAIALMSTASGGSALAAPIPIDGVVFADARPPAPSGNQQPARPGSEAPSLGSSERRDDRQAVPPPSTRAPQPTPEPRQPTPEPRQPTPEPRQPTPPPSPTVAINPNAGRPTAPPTLPPDATRRPDDDRPPLPPGATPPARPTLPPDATRRPDDDRPPLPPGATPDRPSRPSNPDPADSPDLEHLPISFVPGPDPLIISPHLETSFVTTGTLATGTFVAFPVQGVAGNELRVEASGFDTVIEVTGLDGTIIATDDNGLGDGMGGSAVNFQMPDDGAATVTLRGIGDSSGDYRVAVTPVHHDADRPDAPPA